jgi:hypothetical protein
MTKAQFVAVQSIIATTTDNDTKLRQKVSNQFATISTENIQ